jgi:NADPH:quinone reductase-like Zn-dependent oxidoreductase
VAREDTMKAIVQERYGSPDFLAFREIDPPIAADDRVLVRVRAASVNALDWHLMQRLPHVIGKLLRQPDSRVPGVDMAGVVAAVGARVTQYKIGDEVFGAGNGAFAEYATSTEQRLAGAPESHGFTAPFARLLGGLLLSNATPRVAPFLARGHHEDLITLKNLAEAGKLTPVIDREYPLREAADAIRHVGTRQARGKIVININIA